MRTLIRSLFLLLISIFLFVGCDIKSIGSSVESRPLSFASCLYDVAAEKDPSITYPKTTLCRTYEEFSDYTKDFPNAVTKSIVNSDLAYDQVNRIKAANYFDNNYIIIIDMYAQEHVYPRIKDVERNGNQIQIHYGYDDDEKSPAQCYQEFIEVSIKDMNGVTQINDISVD